MLSSAVKIRFVEYVWIQWLKRNLLHLADLGFSKNVIISSVSNVLESGAELNSLKQEQLGKLTELEASEKSHSNLIS